MNHTSSPILHSDREQTLASNLFGLKNRQNPLYLHFIRLSASHLVWLLQQLSAFYNEDTQVLFSLVLQPLLDLLFLHFLFLSMNLIIL